MTIDHAQCDERRVNPLRTDHTCMVCEHGYTFGAILTNGNGDEQDRRHRDAKLRALDALLADPCVNHPEGMI